MQTTPIGFDDRSINQSNQIYFTWWFQPFSKKIVESFPQVGVKI